MPFVPSSKKPADVVGGDEAGSGDARSVLHEGQDVTSEAGSNSQTSGSIGRGDTPAGADENQSSDDDSDSRVSETNPGDEIDKETSGNSKKTSLVSRVVRRIASTAVSITKTTVATIGTSRIIGKVLDKTITDEVCVPFIVHGGGALTRELLQKCPSLISGTYTPPNWARNCHTQTLVGFCRMFTLFLNYSRQMVRCEDGGQVALDWLVSSRSGNKAGISGSGMFAPKLFRNSENTNPETVSADTIPDASTLPLDAPVFIMLHGINGGSHEGATKWAVATAATRGWRCVALNLRGCGGAELSSPKVYCAASSTDVRAAVDACHSLYSAAPILLSAYSLGTYVVGTYLAEEDSKPGGAARRNVVGAVLTSCPMEPHSSYAGLSDPDKPTGLMYNGAIAAKLREYFFKHENAVQEHPEVDAKLLNIKAMRTVVDFEKAVICITHGFKNVDEYYEYFSPARIIPSIRTPTLYVVATDDPFLGELEGVTESIRGSKFVSLAHVKRGGHVAFLEKGVGVFGQCWTDKVTGEFLQGVLEPRSQEAEAAALSAGAPTTIIARDNQINNKRIVARTSFANIGEEDEEDEPETRFNAKL